jgi:enoyl-CoA hydratase/carnithine racemase
MSQSSPSEEPITLDEAGIVMVKDIVDRLRAIDAEKQKLAQRTKTEKDQIKEDIKAVAERLNASKRQIQDIVKLVQQAQSDEELLELQRSVLSNAQKVLDA